MLFSFTRASHVDCRIIVSTYCMHAAPKSDLLVNTLTGKSAYGPTKVE